MRPSLRLWNLLWVACFCATQQSLYAQAPGVAAPFTMQDAVAYASAHNPTLLSAQQNLFSMKGQEVEAGLRQNPNFTLYGSDLSNPATSATPYAYSFQLARLFERGQKRRWRLDSARATTAQTEGQFHDQQRGTTLAVKQAFTTMLLAKGALKVAQDELQNYHQQLDIFRVRYNDGDIGKIDFERLDLQLAQFESDQATAEMNLVQTSDQLQTLLGFEQPRRDFDIVGDLVPPPVTGGLVTLEQTALANRPDYKAAQAAVNVADANVKLAYANGATDPTLEGEYDHSGTLSSYGFYVSVPIRIFDRNQGNKDTTKYLAQGSRFSEVAARNQVYSDVDQAWIAYTTSKVLSDRYNGHYLAEAKDILAIAQYAYQHGGIALLDYLNAEYLYNRTRYGFAGALDYKLAEDSDLYAHGLFSNFRDYGQKYEYDFKNSGSSAFHTSVRRPNLQVADLALGGNQVFNHSFVHYQIAVGHSRFGGAAGNPGADFSSSAANPDCAYSPSTTVSIYRPQFTCDNPNDAATDPSQYQLSDINLTTGQATQLNLQAGGAMGINYHLGTHASTLEFGAQFRNEHKGQDAYSPTYDNGDTPPMTQFLSNFTNPHFYGGSYYLPPVTNWNLFTAYLANNPGALPLDEETTHQNSDASNYNLQERVGAGYIMNTLELGSRFHLQTGLRIEGTMTSNTGYLVLTNADGSYGGTTPQYGSGSYVNPLPSVQLRYTIDSNSDIRAVYGRGISRPDPYQLVPYVVFTTGGGPSGVNLVQIGNTGLVAEHANDFDLLYERFLPSVGMIEGGYFYKQITRPIYLQQSIVPATGSSLSQLYAGDYVQQEVNGDHAYVQGIELAYQQHLSSLPGVLGGARMIANFAYTNSKNYNLTNRSDTPQLVGQAPFSWNIGPAYATRRALVTVGVSHNSANIYAYQYQSTGPAAVPYGPAGPNGDNYFYSHTQVDAQGTYYIAKGFSVLASGQNMNNEVFGFYNGSPKYMTQREYYKPTFSFGLRWNPHHEQ